VDAAELDDLVSVIQKADVDAVAISLLFSFANSKNEREVAAALERLGLPLSISHRILPEFREYERASTVVVNGYLAPKMGGYLADLARDVESGFERARLEVMQSSGGIISAKLAAAEPVRTVLSGPAGGVIGAYKLATLAGFDRIIGFDMGGTSTDVCLVDVSAGGLHISNESVVSGIPIGVPMLEFTPRAQGADRLRVLMRAACCA
jgi:N-methylhydantoinase A